MWWFVLYLVVVVGVVMFVKRVCLVFVVIVI